MEGIFHGVLDCVSHILEIEKHDAMCQGTPWGCESGLVLVMGVYVDLI